METFSGEARVKAFSGALNPGLPKAASELQIDKSKSAPPDRTMNCTDLQKCQIERLLGFALNELQFLAARQKNKAAVELAYACHNLPQAHRNDHFELPYFYGLFREFHETHGHLIYDYVAMLDAIRDNLDIDLDKAICGERPVD